MINIDEIIVIVLIKLLLDIWLDFIDVDVEVDINGFDVEVDINGFDVEVGVDIDVCIEFNILIILFKK